MTIKPRPYQTQAIAATKRRRRVTPLEDRYWEKVIKHGPNECWEWTGAKNKKGYGLIGRGGRGDGNERAHRVSWMIHYGPIPEGMFVCHKCDNPECSNPHHLFLGTVQDNNADMVRKGRHVNGECSYSKLTKAEVVEIRKRYQSGKASQYKLADEYNVSRSLIGMIVNGERWKDA